MEAIVAVDWNWGIGRGGDQLVYLSEDLKRFKKLTLGRAVIVGRRTLSTFPGGRPLPGRRNLILSGDKSLAVPGAEVFPGVEALLAAAPEDAVVIGGGTVYRALLHRCRRVYVTKIDAEFPSDTFFPDLDALPEWRAGEVSSPLEQDGIVYRYVTYERGSEDVPG